jgi:hypothetical protein
LIAGITQSTRVMLSTRPLPPVSLEHASLGLFSTLERLRGDGYSEPNHLA